MVSIIIPVKKINRFIEESLAALDDLDYPFVEVIIVPDAFEAAPAEVGPRVRIVPSGAVGPSEKRNIAACVSRGSVLAFLDDDAYPDKNWLSRAMKHFDRPDVAAVGGPAVTPPDEKGRRAASGLVYSSKLGSGKFAYRYVPGRLMEVDDLPSVNLLVRKADFVRIGGFDTSFWPGEDTKFCLDIIAGLKKKIIYDPSVLVRHHRRPLFAAHLRQVWQYAVHRGFFVKQFPRTSRRPAYFVPSLFVAWLLSGGVWLKISPIPFGAYLATLAVYAVALAAAGLKSRPLRLMPLVTLGIAATHVVYGTGFIAGLLRTKLDRQEGV